MLKLMKRNLSEHEKFRFVRSWRDHNHVHNILRLFDVVEQIFLSPQVKRSVKINNKLVTYPR